MVLMVVRICNYEFSEDYYLESENRITIYTNYEIIRQHETVDKYTCLCVEKMSESEFSEL